MNGSGRIHHVRCLQLLRNRLSNRLVRIACSLCPTRYPMNIQMSKNRTNGLQRFHGNRPEECSHNMSAGERSVGQTVDWLSRIIKGAFNGWIQSIRIDEHCLLGRQFSGNCQSASAFLSNDEQNYRNPFCSMHIVGLHTVRTPFHTLQCHTLALLFNPSD